MTLGAGRAEEPAGASCPQRVPLGHLGPWRLHLLPGRLQVHVITLISLTPPYLRKTLHAIFSRK